MAASPREMSFEEPTGSSDLVLVVEGRRLHVNKTVLSIYSPVFERMFTSDFAEREAGEIELPGKQYDSFVRFLLQMYPVSSLEPLKDDSLENLMQLANEYQVDHIFKKCKAFIESHLTLPEKNLTTDKILLYLRMCEIYEPISDLRETLVSVAADRTTAQLQGSRHYGSLQVSVTKDVAIERSKNLERQLQTLNSKMCKTGKYMTDFVKRIDTMSKQCRYGCGLPADEDVCKDCLPSKVRLFIRQCVSTLK